MRGFLKFLSFLFIVFIWYSVILFTPFPLIFSAFLKYYYQPNYNLFSIFEVDGINIHLLIFLLILLFTLTFEFSKSLIRTGKKQSIENKNFSLLKVSFIFFVLLVGFQSWCQNEYWRTILTGYGKKSEVQKKILLFQDSYRFVKFGLEKLPAGEYRGRLMTDLDISQTLEPYTIKYFFFPRVDMFIGEKVPVDCLIVYEKNNPHLVVPKDYTIIGNYNAKGLVALKSK